MSNPKSISVIAVDNHPLVLRGIASVLEAEADIALVAQVANGDDALRIIKESGPDVALLKLHMPGKGGLEVTSALQEMRSKTRPVILAADMTHEEFVQAMQFGVRGVFLSTMPLSLLVRCVRMVHAGEEFVERNMCLRAFGKLLKHSIVKKRISTVLTPRELAVVELTVEGLSNKLVARKLAITEGTVKLHLHRAYEKLRVRGRVDLIHFAHRNGLI